MLFGDRSVFCTQHTASVSVRLTFFNHPVLFSQFARQEEAGWTDESMDKAATWCL